MKEIDIVALYKKSATETPSPELDQRILDYAKAHGKKPIHYRRYFALAASIGLVAIMAPWRWYSSTEQGIPAIETLQLQQSQSDVIRSESILPARESVRVLSQPKRKSLMPEKKLQAIESVLQSGDRQQAKMMLEELIKSDPELKGKLPEKLKRLLDEK